MSHLHGAAIAICLLLAPALMAQEIGEVDILLSRLSQYLESYESELRTVIAEEHYEQSEYRPLNRANLELLRRRTTISDIAFLRLPDGSAWFGVRDVRTVDGKPVAANESRLGELLKQLDKKAFEQIVRIVAESAQYNLGGPRTINMPTTPLEILQPVHHVRYIFKMHGGARIEGHQTRRIDFEEFDEPTIVSGTEGTPVFIHGSAWVEPDNGRLWRVELTLKPKVTPQLARPVDNRLRVDFTFHPELKMLVPAQMDETFWIPGGRGQGRAKYSNFRQFTTSARIVPQD
jgi:hypothetical protein